MLDRCDQVWCLGDVVGYGASPNECVDVVRDRCRVVLAGNHDLAAAGASTRRASRTTPAAPSAGRARCCAPDCERWLAGLEPAARARPDRPLPRLAARPRVGVRARRGDAPRPRSAPSTRRSCCAATRTVRSPPCSTARGCRRAGAAPRPRGDARRTAARCSTPARSASRATATRARRLLLLYLDDDGRPRARASSCASRTTSARTQREIALAGLPQHLADRLASACRRRRGGRRAVRARALQRARRAQTHPERAPTTRESESPRASRCRAPKRSTTHHETRANTATSRTDDARKRVAARVPVPRTKTLDDASRDAREHRHEPHRRRAKASRRARPGAAHQNARRRITRRARTPPRAAPRARESVSPRASRCRARKRAGSERPFRALEAVSDARSSYAGATYRKRRNASSSTTT